MTKAEHQNRMRPMSAAKTHGAQGAGLRSLLFSPWLHRGLVTGDSRFVAGSQFHCADFCGGCRVLRNGVRS